MGVRVQFLLAGVFLLLALSSCRAKSTAVAAVKVVGLMNCTDCIKNHSSTTNSSLGYEVLIICNANETRGQGNGGVDEHGEFNLTLSDEIAEDSSAINGCYAKLQSRSGAPCRIQSPQTASLKILSNAAASTQEKKVIMNRPTVIKFAPITCQSAFFWPFPNLTFFNPPPAYTPPPTPEDLPPAASPVQPPLPPPQQPPQPSYDPPAPSLPPPEVEAPSPPPASPPANRNPTTPRTRSPSPPPLPPPQAPPPAVVAPPPTPVTSAPPPQPYQEKPQAAPPPSAGISSTPGQRRPSPIPKAPPIPRLPLTPNVPRKYFNPPKSKAKPPHSV